MKSRHVVRRLVPVDFLDLDGLELWLEAMAAKGLHLLKFRALFAQFQPGEPARVRYHAEPTMERRRDAVSNPVGELGWSYVGKLGYLALFRTADPDAPEFHTDPVTQSYTLDQLTRRLTRFVWLLLAMMAALTAFLVWARLDSSFGLVLDLVRYSSLYTSVVYLVDLALIIHFSWTVWGLCRLRRRAPGGHPPPAAPVLAAHRIGAAELHPFIIHLRFSSNLLRHRLFCWSNEVGHGTLHPGPPRPSTFPSGAGWQGLHPGTLWVPRL